MNEYLDALRDAWRRVVRFVERWRAPRRRRVDPSTQAPDASPDRATVVAHADDGILDVVDRLEVARGPDVVLVVPREVRALRDPAAWPHVAAVAKRNQLRLGVVAARGDVRSYARQNGLPAATSVGRVVRSPHHRLQIGDREFYVPRVAWGGLIRLGVLVGGLWILTIVACNTIPSAEVVIVPASEQTTASLRVRLNAIADLPDLELGVQPATSFQHTFTHTIAAVTTGEVEVADERATVILQFSNASEIDRTVSAGTIVGEENGISFTTDADALVPAGSVATIGATAVVGGTTGNVPFDTLIRSDDLPDGVTVTNPASADGGTDKVVPAVSDEDVARVNDIADEVLRRIGERELFEAVTDGTVFPQTISVAIFSQEPLANPGEPADVFLVDFTAVVSAVIVTDAQANATAEALLLSHVGEGQALLPNSTSATLDDARVEGGTVTVELIATGLVADLVDAQLVSEAIKGESPATARSRIEELLALEAPPEIDLRPGFIPWRWLPRNADRISIRYAGPASLLPAAEGDEDGGSTDLLTTAASEATETATATATATATPTAVP